MRSAPNRAEAKIGVAKGVIFGLIFLVYLAAWLGSLDMAARIAALLLIAVKAVGLGALVVLCWKVKKQWDRMEEKLDAIISQLEEWQRLKK